MALAVTARHSGNSGQTAAITLTTDSATESANSLLLVGSAAQNDVHTAAQDGQSLSGGGLSYTQVTQTDVVAWDGSASFRMRGAVHSAPVGGSPSAHTITIDHYIEGAGGDEGFYCAVAVDVTGHDVTTPIREVTGTPNVGTNGSSLGAGDSEQGTVELPNTPIVGNKVVAWFFAGADGSGGFAAPTIGGQPMTERFNQSNSWTQAGVWERTIDGTESDNVVTCTDLGQSVGQYTAVAVEIAAEAGGTDATVTPSVVAVAASVPAPTLSAGSTVTPTAVVATTTVGSPTVAAGSVTTPATVAATTSIPAPTVTAGASATATPAAVSAAATVPSATISAGSTVTPATVTAAASIAAPATAAGSTATPLTVTATATIGSPTIGASSTVMPSTVAGTAAVPAPTVSAGGSVTVTPGVVQGTATIGAPTVSTGSTVTASTVAASTSVPSPTVSGAVSIGPATVTVTTAIPAVGVQASSTVTPAAVAGTATIPAATVTVGEQAESIVTAQGTHSLIATVTGTYAATVAANGTHDLIVEAEGAL